MKVVATVLALATAAFAATCPDGSSCDGTCCELSTGKYGCCPYQSATCCSDHEHCCPQQYPVCDVKDGQCKPSGAAPWGVPMLKKTASVPAPVVPKADPTDVTCPDGSSSCPTGNTCCKTSSGSYGCCPLPNADCCSDGVHCCPQGYTCDVKAGTCNQGNGASWGLPWVTKVAARAL